HTVDVTGDAGAVLDRLRAFRPEIVLLDIGLPGKDGYELAREIRAVHGFDHVSLVALTGYGQPADRERALSSGFSEHLIKPVHPDALCAVLGRLPVQKSA